MSVKFHLLHLFLLINAGNRQLVLQCLKLLLMIHILHQSILKPWILLTLIPLIQTGLLPSEKVLDPLVILILSIIFWVIIVCLLHILPLFSLYLRILFLLIFMRRLVILDGDRQWLMKCRLLNIVVLGNLSLFHLARRLWVVWNVWRWHSD